MSKMIAIINEPDDCFDCPLLYKGVGLNNQCTLSNKWMGSIDLTKRPNWCELKLFPQKIDEYDSIKYQWGDYEDGWNHCVDSLIES